MVIKLLIISVVVVMISFAFLAVRILLRNNGRFPETHISRNSEMRKRGIKCAQHNDIGCNSSEDFPGCSTCGERRL